MCALATTMASMPTIMAQMIYADGLTTLFAFGGIYAAGTFGMTLSDYTVNTNLPDSLFATPAKGNGDGTRVKVRVGSGRKS